MKVMTRFALVAAVLMLLVGVVRAGENMVPCGEITGMELKDSVNEDDLSWDVRMFGKRPTLEGTQKFAVITVELGPNKSIGKRDFTLADEECLAIAKPGAAFNPETWMYDDLEEGTAVRLLFKVDGEADKDPDGGYTFSYKYAEKLTAAYKGEKAKMVNQTINTKSVGAPDSSDPVDPTAADDDDDDDDDDDVKPKKKKPDGGGDKPKKKKKPDDQNWDI